MEQENLTKIICRLAESAGWGTCSLPENYLVLDVETTGFSSQKNKVVSLGMCIVENGEFSHEFYEEDYVNLILKWPEEVFVGAEKAIEIHGIDFTKSQEEGIPPIEVMGILDAALKWADERNMFIVGHNLVKFDLPFLEAEMRRAGLQVTIDPNRAVDTHIICKAMQTGTVPGVGESPFFYYQRVADFRAKGVYSNLDRYCMERFGLEKHGACQEDAHNSGYDCWLTHLVVQELNELINTEGV